MLGRRRGPEHRFLWGHLLLLVAEVRRPAGRRLRTDARPDAGADTSSDLCAQSEPDAAPQRAPGAAANVDAQPTPDAQALGRADAATNAAAQPAPDAHALVSQKDAAADPSAIAAPYT